MFGLKAFFAGLSRLTTAINHSADLFETANEQLERQLGLESGEPTAPALEHAAITPALEDRPARRNGRK
jgi:hypothetical protein